MTNLKSAIFAAAAAAAGVVTGQPVPSLLPTDGGSAAQGPPADAAATTPSLVQSTTVMPPAAGTVGPFDGPTLVPGVVINTPFPGGLFAGADADGIDDGVQQQAVQSVMAGAPQGYPSGGLTASGLRIAVGGSIDPNTIPNQYFTTFDVRPSINGPISGFQSAQPWTPESVAVAQGTSSAGTTQVAKHSVITSDQDMTSALSVAVTANGAYLGDVATVKASFGYSQKSDSTVHRVSGLSMGILSQQGVMLANEAALQLSPDALSALTSDVNAFIDIYGTHFIKTKVFGCQATALYTFSCTSQSAATDIAAALNANYNGGTFSVGGGVNSTYSQYQKENVCSYDGSFQASGLGTHTLSASSAQLMNATTMDNFWNGFGSFCADAYKSGASQLINVELGNWMEVPAVRNAVAGNKTASDILTFYALFQPADLTALMYGGLYQDSVQSTAQAVSQQPDLMRPFATTSVFDRNGLVSDYITQAYWDGLPQAHANIQQRLDSTTFGSYFNPSKVAQAVSAYQPASSLVKKYFGDMAQLYKDASAAYQWVYMGMSGVFRSFDSNGLPVAATTNAAATTACTGAGPRGQQLCSSASVQVGADTYTFGIGVIADMATPFRFICGWLMLPGHDNTLAMTTQGLNGFLDITSRVPNNPNKLPVRVDFSTYFVMDTTLYAKPY